MPLDDFIAEVMEILQTEDEVKEVCVKRLHPLRFAAEAGQEQYQKFFEQFNDRMHK
ncbi:MAG TPA: hypothetical protein VH207_14565 [Chthoniobacterales bacterium]|jgi:uncharacterized oxidoreductase|nr:hypothetical protein [Chthoniobacterales bacterium]